ncbi:DUF6545 domain-containing protein, partial [Nonomuraea sp. NPDC049695]|uniref:DUF6545 domain-containing protein n=1 Tax=Nonomuraea sp. NPDC049695 TaxID=3154734 RepID=UPI0034259715
TLSRRESHIAVRWALRVLAVTSIGSGSRAVYTLATIIAPHAPWRWSTPVALRMNVVWSCIAFIGITVLGVVGLAQQRTARRQLEALAPLHQALATALPGWPVRYDDPEMPVEQALIARYTRIEDGLRQLRAHGDPAVLVQARQFVRARWVLGRKRREAIAVAAWIALMLQRLERGIRLEAHDAGFPTPSTRSINQDIAQLVRVALAFERHPLVGRFVETFEPQADQSSLIG